MRVNRNGFVTLYTLLLMQVIVSVAILLMQRCVMNQSVATPMPYHDAQIIAVYRIKARFKQVQNRESLPTEDASTTDSEEEKKMIMAIEQEQIFHEGLTIQIEYDLDQCDVTIADLHMRIYYDIAQGTILDLVYLSSP